VKRKRHLGFLTTLQNQHQRWSLIAGVLGLQALEPNLQVGLLLMGVLEAVKTGEDVEILGLTQLIPRADQTQAHSHTVSDYILPSS